MSSRSSTIRPSPSRSTSVSLPAMRHVPEAMVFDSVPRLAALIDSSPSTSIRMSYSYQSDGSESGFPSYTASVIDPSAVDHVVLGCVSGKCSLRYFVSSKTTAMSASVTIVTVPNR